VDRIIQKHACSVVWLQHRSQSAVLATTAAELLLQLQLTPMS
jgi:hypothetical protein